MNYASVMNKKTAISSILAMSMLSAPALAADDTRKYGIGFGMSTPAFGLVLSRKYSQRLGIKLVSDFDESFSIQVDMYGSEKSNAYWTVGLGRDSFVAGIKGGYGYEKRLGILTWNGEFGLNFPFDSEDNLGLAGLGYVWNFGLGVRYEF